MTILLPTFLYVIGLVDHLNYLQPNSVGTVYSRRHHENRGAYSHQEVKSLVLPAISVWAPCSRSGHQEGETQLSFVPMHSVPVTGTSSLTTEL